MTDLVLTIDGPPRGKARPRVTHAGHAYTPAETIAAEDRVRIAWKQAGSVRLPDGALALHVVVCHERPRGHYRRDGQRLNAEGRRHPLPTRKPDGDNALKLIADSLSGLAFRDDAQIVDWRLVARWDDRARTAIRVVAVNGWHEVMGDIAHGIFPTPTPLRKRE